MTLSWAVDTYLFPEEQRAEYQQAFAEAQVPVTFAKYVPFQFEQDYGPTTDVKIVYGTTGYIGKYPDKDKPGFFGNYKNLGVPYLHQHYNEYALNTEGSVTDWWRLKAFCLETNDPNLRMFIRPRVGWKQFPGGVITVSVAGMEEFEERCANYRLDPFAEIVNYPIKEIQAEYRFVIVRDWVVSGSQYRRDGVLDVRRDVAPDALLYAAKLARLPQRPADVYVMDIAVTEAEGPKLLEFNAFASAGWYAGDKIEIIRAVTNHVEAHLG